MPDAPRYAIEAHNLAKTFRRHGKRYPALGGVSFSVPQGVVFSILGPNGAGKTTLLRILTTTLAPDSGTALIGGFDLQKQPLAIRNLIGVVAQSSNFDRYLSLWHNLTLHAQMHGIPKPDYEKRIKVLLERMDLYERRNDLADDLSGGMQRRLALIRALIHEPQILFLDEPTTGLDPEARREIWDTLQRIKGKTTIILTTHYMEEADTLSDHIMMMNRGQIVNTGTPTELKHQLAPDNAYDLVLKTPTAAHYEQLLAQYGARVEHLNDHHVRMHLQSPHDLKLLMGQMNWADFERLGSSDADLETVYLAMAKSGAGA